MNHNARFYCILQVCLYICFIIRPLLLAYLAEFHRKLAQSLQTSTHFTTQNTSTKTKVKLLSNKRDINVKQIPVTGPNKSCY